MIFSVGGQSIFPISDPFSALGYMSTAIASSLVKAMLGRIDIDPQFEAGVIKRLPFPSLVGHEDDLRAHVEDIIQSIITVLVDETSAYFLFPWPDHVPNELLQASNAIQCVVDIRRSSDETRTDRDNSCRFTRSLRRRNCLCRSGFSVQRSDFEHLGEFIETGKRIMSYLVGVIFGRWDAVGDQEHWSKSMCTDGLSDFRKVN